MVRENRDGQKRRAAKTTIRVWIDGAEHIGLKK